MAELKLDINLYISKLRKLGLFIQDVENNIAYPNHLWDEMGYTPEEMVNMGYLNYVHPDDKPELERSMEKLLDMNESVNRVLFRMKSKGGSWRWILSTSLGVEQDGEGRIVRYVGYDHDITEEMLARERAEKALREAETLRSTGEIITSCLKLPDTIEAILDQANRVIPCASASVQLIRANELEIVGAMGFDPENSVMGRRFLITDNIPNFQIIDRKSPIIVNNNLKERYSGFTDIAEQGIQSWMGVPLIYNDRVIGILSFDQLEEDGFNDEDRRLAQAFANQVSIALENARLYEEAREKSIRDDLTGSFTRGHLYSCLEREADIANRYSTPLSIIMLDIDDFKLVNDEFGHLKGDLVLREIVKICSRNLRKTDILGRYGGEEFVALLPSSGIAEACAAAERIRKSVEEELLNLLDRRKVTISLGCTSYCRMMR